MFCATEGLFIGIIRGMERNVHFAPVFEQTNETMNAGSVILMGDCYASR